MIADGQDAVEDNPHHYDDDVVQPEELPTEAPLPLPPPLPPVEDPHQNMPRERVGRLFKRRGYRHEKSFEHGPFNIYFNDCGRTRSRTVSSYVAICIHDTLHGPGCKKEFAINQPHEEAVRRRLMRWCNAAFDFDTKRDHMDFLPPYDSPELPSEVDLTAACPQLHAPVPQAALRRESLLMRTVFVGTCGLILLLWLSYDEEIVSVC